MMEEFIKILTDQIRYPKARDLVAHEISDHILDQAQAYEDSGMPHEQAIEKAVHEMGDPVETGVALDRIHRPLIDWKMIVMTFGFSILGFIIMYTVGGLSEKYSVTKQILFMLAGFCVTIGTYFLDYSFIGKYALALYLFMTIGFAAYYITATPINGRVPGLSVLVYLYAPVYAGLLYRYRGKGYAAIIKGIAALLITSWIIPMLSNSSSSAVNLYFICTAMLIIAVCKKWFRVNKKFTLAAIAILLFVIPISFAIYTVYFGSGYSAMRMRAFLNPSVHQSGAGYLYAMIREYLANAKLIGAGSLSDSAYHYPLTDAGVFVPLLLVQSCGLFTGCVLVLALAVFIIRAFHITYYQKNQLGFMVSAACSLIFLVNCCESLFLNIGMCPLTNIQPPFLSYGGCTTLTYAVLIGLLLSVHRYSSIAADHMPKNTVRRHLI